MADMALTVAYHVLRTVMVICYVTGKVVAADRDAKMATDGIGVVMVSLVKYQKSDRYYNNYEKVNWRKITTKIAHLHADFGQNISLNTNIAGFIYD